MNVLGVKVTDLVNNGNYYDVVQLQDSNHFDKAWDIKEDITDVQGEGEYQFRRPARQYRHSGGQAEAGIDRPAHQYGSLADPALDVDEGASYTDVLPSLNLYYDLDRHNRIRFALAKVMARPRMDDMRANLVPGFDGGVCSGPARQNLPPCGPGVTVNPWSANGGNPKLEPWRAKEAGRRL